MSALQLSSGPTTQVVLFVLTDEDHGVRCLILATILASPCLRVSSSFEPRISEDGHLLRSLLVLGSVFIDTLSSRTFGTRTKGGVPNSSPSEPRPDLREGRGFDPVGAISAPKRHPSGWAPRRCPAKHSPCSLAKNVILSPREQDFRIKLLVCAQIIELKMLCFEKTKLPLGSLILDT